MTGQRQVGITHPSNDHPLISYIYDIISSSSPSKHPIAYWIIESSWNVPCSEDPLRILCLLHPFLGPPAIFSAWLISTILLTSPAAAILQRVFLQFSCWVWHPSSVFLVLPFAYGSFITLHFNDWIHHLPFPLKCEIFQVLAYISHICILNT